MQQFRFHVIGLPHTEVTKEFLPCAYSQKVLNFCKMMKSLGHIVYLYAGGEKTDAPCDEFISCISSQEQQKYFGATDWRKDMFPIEWNETLPYWVTMNNNAVMGIKQRGKPKDFVCLIGGSCQMPIVNALPEYLCMEFGVGYKGIYAPFRVFESYAWMHHVYGLQKIENGQSYDCVIPNYFDPEDFPYTPDIKPEDYFLYIGRMITRKGAHIAVEACGVTESKLKMAGQGFIFVDREKGIYKSREFEVSGNHIEYLGTVDVKQRFDLMSKAKAVFTLTQYIGPFEGVQVEANLCGTPVITTDWGCFSENVIDGLNGYRTRTMAEIIWAMNNVDKLDRVKIREFALKNFSMDRVKWQYQAYFEQLATLWDKGWYNKHYDPQYKRYHKFI